ncbi:MAG: flagellar hook-associated protein FlgK [Desulfobacterales bacterium]|jgi:flagellar hook-associated protein 1 FlgK|nr:flagellar hook-associated protein FlgK [Deltaproteobacteria bacterium]
MSDIGGILSISSQALLTQQKAMNVTSHNIANVNTPGYSRQRLRMSTNTPASMSIGMVGSGVSADSVERIYDRFLSDQINVENQELGRWDAQKGAVEVVETIFNESDGYGLNHVMSRFWEAWQSLTNNPTGQTERQILITDSQALARTFNQLVADLSQAQEDLDIIIEGTVADVNRLSEQLVDLNQKIISAEANTSVANDYRDSREQVLKELSELIDINSFEDSFGATHVLLNNGWPLVGGSQSWQLSTQINAFGLNDVVWLDPSGSPVDVTGDIDGGKLKGYLKVRDDIITDDLNRLDTLAQTLMTDINTLHQAGFALDGSPGLAFFNGTGAGNMALNTTIAGSPDLIAAAADAATVPGDNRQAIAIAELQYQLRMSGNTATYNDYYSAVIRDTGNEVLQSDAYYHHQSDMMAQLENRRESISGVSLDEEMINLMKFQNAYTAAAKMISTADEMMQTVMQMV